MRSAAGNPSRYGEFEWQSPEEHLGFRIRGFQFVARRMARICIAQNSPTLARSVREQLQARLSQSKIFAPRLLPRLAKMAALPVDCHVEGSLSFEFNPNFSNFNFEKFICNSYSHEESMNAAKS